MSEYIDRELALSMPFANGHYDHENANEHFIFGCETYKEWLETLPAADVRENIYGEWTSKETFFDDLDVFVCSNCKMRFATRDLRSWNYCPNCGARMDERREDEDYY